jgi:hypothetical protein
MEESSKVEKLVHHIKEYVETRGDIFILRVQEKLADVISSLVFSVVIGFLALFILLFISLGGALWLCEYCQSSFIGFFYVGGFYLLLALLLILRRDKWIKLPIINSLIKKISLHEED